MAANINTIIKRCHDELVETWVLVAQVFSKLKMIIKMDVICGRKLR
jgi:hypothetical protein